MSRGAMAVARKRRETSYVRPELDTEPAADVRRLARTSCLLADYAPARFGARMALADYVVVCAEAGTADQAVAEARRTQPDLCLVGLDIPGGGIEAVRRICESVPGTAVIVLAGASDVDDFLSAVRAGAVGYAAGSVDRNHLRRVVEAVVAHQAVVPRSMLLTILEELRGAGVGRRAAVTAREAQILGMLRRDRSTAWIAERLSISPVTVRRHISDLMRKRGAKDRAELAACSRSMVDSGA